MSKVTSKLQVTIPKAIAERYGIAPGDDIEWLPAGESIRIVPPGAAAAEEIPVEERLAIFDATAERLERLWREDRDPRTRRPDDVQPGDEGGRQRRRHEIERGWTREELYERGRPA